ncbi:MAG: nuclear transport factor 2 family protein [Acidimicrobiales bacterium]
MIIDDNDNVVDDNDAVVRLWHRLWIDGDHTAATELLSDPFVRHTVEGRTVDTASAYGLHVCTVTRHLKGTNVVIDHLSHTGDITHIRFTLEGVNLTTGEPISIGWIAQYRSENGRIAEAWTMRQTDFSWRD